MSIDFQQYWFGNCVFICKLKGIPGQDFFLFFVHNFIAFGVNLQPWTLLQCKLRKTISHVLCVLVDERAQTSYFSIVPSYVDCDLFTKFNDILVIYAQVLHDIAVIPSDNFMSVPFGLEKKWHIKWHLLA